MVSSYRPLLRFKTPTDNPGYTFYSTVTEGITYFTNDQIMSSNQQNQQSRSKGEPSGSSKDSSKPKSDEWTDVKDPNERRKIQNKLAQRRFRDKVREQKEESEREAENQRRAGASYATPEPRDIASSSELSGLPWGGISMRHIVETGKSKEQSSRQGSRENSVYGSSSR